MTVGQLSNPTLGSADFARVPLGAVPGLTWSLSNDCLYDTQLEDTPLTINTISDGMDCFLSNLPFFCLETIYNKAKCLERSVSLISFAYSNISQKIISCEFKSQT